MKKESIIKIVIIILGTVSLLLNNYLSYLLIIPIWYLIIKCFSTNKRETIYLLIFSFIFSLSQIIGYNCFKYDTAKLNNIKTYLSLFSLIPIIYLISKYIFNINLHLKNKKNNFLEILFNKKYSFILVTLIIFISWLPILIGFYPGNFSYDAGTQMRMLKFNLITKYHPVIHTMFLYITIFLGNKIKSYTLGLLIHSICQMLIMSSIFSYTLIYLYKKKIPNYLIVIFLIIYMFLPTHSVFSITTTKDIIFSGLFNLVLIKLIDLSLNSNKFLINKKNIIITIILLYLLFSFRNNMLYAFILFIPFMLFILKKDYKKVLLLIIGSILIFKTYDISLTKIFKIENGPRAEMFSFVIQQFARTYNKEKINTNDKIMIENLYNNNSLKDYNSHISDPVKSNFNSEELLKNKVTYLKLYTKLLLKYPNTYLDSILNNIYGFFYLGEKLPDPGTKTYIEINCLDASNNTINRSNKCKKNNPIIYNFYYNLVNNATYQKIPILNIFMNMAFYFIILIFVGITILLKKNYKLFIPILLLFCYMLTNLLAPVAIVRYAYPLFTTFPLICYLYYYNLKEKKS